LAYKKTLDENKIAGATTEDVDAIRTDLIS